MAKSEEKFKNVFIVGAGFSFHAGLPLTGDFTEALLYLKGLKEEGDWQTTFESTQHWSRTALG